MARFIMLLIQFQIACRSFKALRRARISSGLSDSRRSVPNFSTQNDASADP